MAVKLELYRVFQEVARMGNISAAAQNLFISQSAVSQSIKQLEEQLQVRLFSRSTRGVVLTSEGKLLLDYVSHGLGLIQCGEEKLAQSRQLLTGELIIGASDTVTKTYLVSRLEAFHQNYPAIQIRILNGTSQMVLDYLHAGQVDIAFASEPKDKDAYSVRHCFDTHQLFVAAPNYDCDFDHVHSMEEIAAFPLILLERKASSRIYVEQFFQQHGVSIKPEIELGSHNLLISLARIGLGVACVTEEFSQSGLGRGVILPLRTDFEIPPRSVCMCTLRDVAPTSAANRFMDFISESDKMAYDLGHSYNFKTVSIENMGRFGGWSSLRRPILFRLAGKEWGEKGRLDAFGAYCGYGLGKSLFLGITNTRTHPTGDLVRAACYGTSDLQVAAFEWLL